MSGGEFECPKCPRSFTATGLKQHWTKIHGGEYPPEIVEQTQDLGPNYVVKEFDCEHCGTTFNREVKPKETRQYCSHSCQSQGTATKTDPRKAKEDPRKRALERDEYTCQRCGQEVEDGLRDEDSSAEVHHLFPKMAGGTDAMENLVTLCWKFHRKAHQEMKSLPEEKPELLRELREIICQAT